MSAVARAAIRLHAALYRLSGGKIGGRRGTVPMLLLTTVGRATGRRRTVPVQSLADGGSLVVAASNGGRDMWPGYDEYRRRTRREIPLIVLRPAWAASA